MPTTTSRPNPLRTPPHIVPEWYFLPFYAILRAIPDKLIGVIALFGVDRDPGASLPWLDTSQGAFGATTGRSSGSSSGCSSSVCIGLGYLGAKPPEGG